MKTRYCKPGVRTFIAAAAAFLYLGVAGCSKTPAPEEAAKKVSPPAPVAAPAVKAQKAPPPANPASAADAALAASVRAALSADSRLKTFAIDVRSSNGNVDLFGTVDSKSSREKAEKIAAGVDGVKSVKNHLVLVSGS